MQTMKANIFHGPNNIRVEEVPRPHAGAGEAVIRITLTTICGTDLHILRGEYPVKPGLVIGHEPVGVIEELGEGLTGYKVGDRVLVGAITPCGQCRACLSGQWAQCGHGEGVEAIGGWRFGNTINGAQAEYLLIPNAQANLAKIPDELSDEQVVLLADIASTGFSGAESANIRIGDTVAVFAQGPIGLCATAGAKLMGASFIVAVDSDPVRMKMSKRMGADVLVDPNQCDVVAEIRKLTGGGTDVAIEALGLQETFENCLRSLRPGGTLSSLGVYSRRLQNRDNPLPRRKGTDATADVNGAIEAVRSDPASHTHFHARSNRRGVRSVQFAARRLLKGCDQALTTKHRDESHNSRARAKGAGRETPIHQMVR
jgi:threonine dehydrogenase-like Zn-dependent dehydrogenase